MDNIKVPLNPGDLLVPDDSPLHYLLAQHGLQVTKISAITNPKTNVTRYCLRLVLDCDTCYQKWFHSNWSDSPERLIADAIETIESLPEETDMNIFSTSLFEYLSGDMIGDKQVTLTIKDVRMKQLNNGKTNEEKPVVSFREKDKLMVLNKTNARELAAKMGSETNNWRGRKVVLVAPLIDAFGKTMRSIRVIDVLPGGQDEPLFAEAETPGAFTEE